MSASEASEKSFFDWFEEYMTEVRGVSRDEFMLRCAAASDVGIGVDGQQIEAIIISPEMAHAVDAYRLERTTE